MAYLIALDSGHGKETAGKRSFDSTLLEWEFNRDVTARINNYLLDHGVATILTAPTNNDTSLEERVHMANTVKADLFVSIHANAWGDGWNTVNGWEIFYSKGSARGAELANYIYDESIPYLGIKSRGIKYTTELYVVRKTIAPAVLIEHGFYTNKEELELLKSNAFREKCAIADSKGILKYLGIKWKYDTDYKALYENAQSQIETYRRVIGEVKNILEAIS